MFKQNDSKPIARFRAGNIEASVWKNELNTDEQTIVRHFIRIETQFRNDDGNYRNMDCYFPSDLPKLILVARKAFEFVVLTESKETNDCDRSEVGSPNSS